MDPLLALQTIDPRTAEAPEQLAAACTELGFFRIPASLLPTGVVEAAWNDAGRFFELDIDTKNEVAFPEPGYPYGYSPFRTETLAASLGDQQAGPDLKESFSVGPDCLDDAAVDGGPVTADEAWIRSPSLWPANPERMQQSWEACFIAMSDVAADLLSVMAIALDLSADHFASLIDRHSSAMRALHYPALAGPTREGELRAGAHTDYGTLTILVTDGVPGLQIKDGRGRWRPVEHRPNTYVVNLGDSIAQWTNDRWRSTLHRVTTISDQPRRSMAFFHTANWDATIDCLPTCHGPNDPARYPPVKAGPWLMEKFSRSVG